MSGTTSGYSLAKGYKRPSELAKKHGSARTLLLDMTRRAETKLMELQRASHARASEEVKAEDLAEQLFHTPGSLLTQEEFAKIYYESGCSELVEEPRNCNHASVHTFRMYEGTCNNLARPILGASSTPFRRLIPAWYEDGCDSPVGRLQHISAPGMSHGFFSPPNPSARFVSMEIVKDREIEDNVFTHILMQWGQFLDHDMDLAPEPEGVICETCEINELCEPIHIPDLDDVFYQKGSTADGMCLSFKRSLAACGSDDIRYGIGPREQINDVTAYIDASMVYGSTQLVAEALAEYDGDEKTGLMRTSNDGKDLPNSDLESHLVICPSGDCYDAGDVRVNEQAGLVTMHTLLVREHNRIAKQLLVLNPHWSGERVYQEARKIVGAVVQKITYDDYLPKLLGRRTSRIVLGDYEGYDPDVDPSIANSFATAAYRYGHSLVRPVFFKYLSDEYEDGEVEELHLIDSFFNKLAYTQHGLAAIARGLVTDSSLHMDEFVNAELTTKLFFNATSGKGLDLASLNIQRQRDHGMPKYGTWVNFCEKQFPELPRGVFEHHLTKVRFMQSYGSVENADLWVAGIAEQRLGDSMLGPTFACIFGLTFRNSRSGDRFYYENEDVDGEGEPVFSDDQRRAIKETTLASIICRNTGISIIQPDVFESSNRPGNDREECSNIPALDLSQWSEDPCYVRINVGSVPPDASYITLFDTYLQVHTTTETITPPANHVCTAIACPPYKRLRLRVATDQASELCRALPNDNLPEDNNERQHIYTANGGAIGESYLDDNAGIYSTLAACNNPTALPAVTFTCDPSNVASAAASKGSPVDCEDVVGSVECEEEDGRTGAGAQNAKDQYPHLSTVFDQEMELLKELKDELEKVN